MMPNLSYQERRDKLHHYFDRTAVEAWRRMMSDEPLGRIRATVRAGRAEMRRHLLAALPADLHGLRILDAGCGQGDLAFALAERGGDVVGVDIAEGLLSHGRSRSGGVSGGGRVRFEHGDMCDPALGQFDFIVAMDSLIHYRPADMLAVLSHMARRSERAIVFTFAPQTPLLAAMHMTGRLFPRGDRAPAIEPVRETALRRQVARTPGLAGWRTATSRRVARGFYISQSMELLRQ